MATSPNQINLPAHGWLPRDYQRPAWAALESGVKRLALAWHRRSGKDDVSLHWAATAAMERVGTYWHMLPEASQSRKAIWDAVNPHTGRRRIDDAFPEQIRSKTRDQDMLIKFRNGSTWQVLGSDNYNSLVGSPPVGVVFSEYALADPSAWAFLRPILAENGGWAIFISTTRGRNHFSRMVDFAKGDADWFGQTLTVEDTGVIKSAVIETERRELIAERGEKEANAIIRQEYYCDPDAAIPGAYYGEFMSDLDKQGRIGNYPWMPEKPVLCSFDIGYRDSTAVWFGQWTGERWRFVDYFEGSGVGVDWYAAQLSKRPYIYETALFPHDAGNGSVQTGKSFSQLAREHGIKNRVLPQEESVNNGIQEVRKLLRNAEFNIEPVPIMGETPEEGRSRMQRGIDCLRNYRRKWNETAQRFDDKPLHDWTSNGADSLRYFAMGKKVPEQRPMAQGSIRMQGGLARGRQSWSPFG